MSLLTIVRKVCPLVGLERPSTVVESSDLAVQTLFELANEEGAELARRHAWQVLNREHTFLTVAAEAQTNTPVPDDFDSFVPDTIFNRTSGRKVLGPISSREWQAIQARPEAGRVYLSFRQREGEIRLTPSPAAGELIAYEYVSTKWARSSAGVGRTAFTVDEDEAYLPERLIELGLRWRWKAAKGLDYGEDMRTYELAVLDAMGKDGGAGELCIGADHQPDDWRANIPETIDVS